METTSRQINVTIIKPSEGKYLTQVSLEDEMQRVFSKELWLSENDSPANWREADEEEKAAYEAMIQEQTN